MWKVKSSKRRREYIYIIKNIIRHHKKPLWDYTWREKITKRESILYFIHDD